MSETINKAIEKIDKEAEKKNNPYVTIVASHIIDNYLKSEENAAKVLDEKKTLSSCLNDIKRRAKNMAHDGMAAVEDDTVFGWVAEYYGFTTAKSGKIIDLFDII